MSNLVDTAQRDWGGSGFCVAPPKGHGGERSGGHAAAFLLETESLDRDSYKDEHR